jgi:predicted SAM-dependent methyltransferase
MKKQLKLSIAGGQNIPDGFVGMDIYPGKNIKYVGDILNFGDDSVWKQLKKNSVDQIECSHFIEHIPHGNGYNDPFWQFFDEVYRVLKPATFDENNPNIPTSGFATFVAPYYSSMRAWQDPTHQRAISDMTFYYLSKEWREANKLDHYPVKCDFKFAGSYNINGRLMNRNQEFQSNAYQTQINAIDDIVVTLWKEK